MIASNFIRFPGALLAQRELELVIAAPEALTREASDMMRKSIKATVAWICQFTTAPTKRTTPVWFETMKRKAMALARKVRGACMSLF